MKTLIYLIDFMEKQLNSIGFIKFDQFDLKKMSYKDAQILEKHFHGRALMELPLEEI